MNAQITAAHVDSAKIIAGDPVNSSPMGQGMHMARVNDIAQTLATFCEMTGIDADRARDKIQMVSQVPDMSGEMASTRAGQPIAA